MHQHRDGAAFGTWPDVRQQRLHGAAPNAVPAPGAHHEELTQVNFVGVFTPPRRTMAARLVFGMMLTRRTSSRVKVICSPRYNLRTAKEHNGGRRWQELTAQGEGTLRNLADGVTAASVLHKSQSLLRCVDVHGNDQGRP